MEEEGCFIDLTTDPASLIGSSEPEDTPDSLEDMYEDSPLEAGRRSASMQTWIAPLATSGERGPPWRPQAQRHEGGSHRAATLAGAAVGGRGGDGCEGIGAVYVLAVGPSSGASALPRAVLMENLPQRTCSSARAAIWLCIANANMRWMQRGAEWY